MAWSARSKIIFCSIASLVLVFIVVKLFSRDEDNIGLSTTESLPDISSTSTSLSISSTSPVPAISTTNTPEKCEMDLSFDTATYIGGKLYMFKGTQFREIGEKSNFTYSIKEAWKKLNEDRLDAAYEMPEKKEILFIRGENVHIFNRNSHNRTQTLSEYFRIASDIPKIDAIFQNPEDNHTYIISGKKQWMLDDKDPQPPAADAIKAKWKKAFEMKVNAVFRDGENLVFLEDENYVVVDKNNNLSPPKPIGPAYFNCGSAYDEENIKYDIHPRFGEGN